ncbi:MAG TPA: hypothetical protein VI854_00120 [Acidimicrobiia bacterium]|nr:hypothetical protein [Acidimicrobiia bacterium]
MDNFVRWLRADWDRVLGFALIVVGALLVLFGYFGASDSPYVDQAISYLISGGIGGLFLLGAGATLLISADLHDEWRKLDRFEDVLRHAGGVNLPGFEAAETDVTERNGAESRRALQAVGPDMDDRERNLMAMVAHGPVTPTVSGTGALALPRPRITIIGMAAGLIVIALGWNHAASHALLGQALDGAVIGAVGLALTGVIGAIWTLSMKRSVQLRKTWLFAPFTLADLVTQRRAATARRSASNGHVLVAEGLTRFHEDGCPAVDGLATCEVDRKRIPAGLTACSLCERA